MPEDDFFKGRALAKAKALRNAPAPAASDPAGPPPAASSPGPRTALPPEAEGRMVDISAKPAVAREAIAEGFLRLQASTLKALAEGRGPKGDPFPAAQVAGILAAKKTPELVPFCHPIPLAAIDVVLSREDGGVRGGPPGSDGPGPRGPAERGSGASEFGWVRCRATVRTTAPTGVEMEALAAVTGALLTVWDMTKALEKDETGNYPGTVIEGIRVVSKTKGSA